MWQSKQRNKVLEERGDAHPSNLPSSTGASKQAPLAACMRGHRCARCRPSVQPPSKDAPRTLDCCCYAACQVQARQLWQRHAGVVRQGQADTIRVISRPSEQIGHVGHGQLAVNLGSEVRLQ